MSTVKRSVEDERVRSRRRLDSLLVKDLLSETMTSRLAGYGIETLADVRKARRLIEDRALVPKSVRKMLFDRLESSLVTCSECGRLLIIYDDFTACESPDIGHARAMPYNPAIGRKRMRRLFPDRISR